MPSTTAPALTALIVDDMRAVRQMLRGMLRQLGVTTVLEAGNGSEALALLDGAGVSVDLLFCDLSMPGMDGVETLRRLAAQQSGSALVLLSAQDPKLVRTVAEMARQQGLHVLGTLGKPFSLAQVAALLRRRIDAPPTAAPDEPLPVSLDELDAALSELAIEVHYLPTVRFADRAFVGVEALARLRHPQRGLLLPAAFVGLAERSGRIGALTERVAELALRQAGAWRSAGLRLEMAINLSAASLQCLDLPEWLAATADREQLPHERITLELTESLIADSAAQLDILSRLRLRHFKLSIDDFGTGHSGLETLRRLPFTEFKIDQSFVRDAPDDPDRRAILESSIRLGRSLHLQVVAEGVETREEWELLSALGCELAQGYFIAAPLVAEQVAVFAGAWARGFSGSAPAPTAR